MERQEVSEGGGICIGSVRVDPEKLGNGSEVSSTINQGGTAAATGSKYTAEQRAIRMEATRRYRAKKFKDRPKKRIGIDWENRKAKQKLWRERNADKRRVQTRAHFLANKEKIYANGKRYEANRTPEQIARDKSYMADYRAKNKSKSKAYMAKWVEENKDHLQKKATEYLPRRKVLSVIRRQNPVERIKDACRTRTLFILKKAGVPKFNHTFDLIGCTPDFFKAHLEAKFKPGMSWENFGEWEIDHIKALSKFDLSIESEKLKAFNFSNCQPLWKPENRSKCNREEPYIRIEYVKKNDTLPSSHQPLFL